MICPKKFMPVAALRVSPGRVPRSLITPARVHITACIGQFTKFCWQPLSSGSVVDQPAAWPSSFTAFAELLSPEPRPLRSDSTPSFHSVAPPISSPVWPTTSPVSLIPLPIVGGKLLPNKGEAAVQPSDFVQKKAH